MYIPKKKKKKTEKGGKQGEYILLLYTKIDIC